MSTSNPTGPAAILARAVGKVTAMKYAVAVAGIAATVAIVAGFRLNYSVLAVGILFTLGLMYAVLSFSRFASKPTKTSRLINAAVAWVFTILIAAVAILFTTAIAFGRPQTLHALLMKNLLPQSEYWKIKVFEFADYGDRAEQKHLGQRFAAKVLDELSKGQTLAMKGARRERVAVVPQRAAVHDAARLYGHRDLAPAVVVTGYIEDAERAGKYAYNVRVTVVSNETLAPVSYETGRIVDNPESLSMNAVIVARKITALAQTIFRWATPVIGA